MISTTETSHIPDLKSITDQIHDGLKRGKFTLTELQQALAHKTKQAAQSTNDLVHHHPWEAVGLGVGIGFAAGLIVSRGMDRTEKQVSTEPSKKDETPSSHFLQSTFFFVLSTIKAIQAFRSIKI